MRIVFLGINQIGKRILDWLQEQDEDVVGMLTEEEELNEISRLRPDIIISGGLRQVTIK